MGALIVTHRSMTLLLLVLLAVSPGAGDEPKEVNWPSYRGAYASGVAEGFSTPTSWDVETSRNIKWKTEIPGLGHSSPVIWGDRIFVTSAISGKENPRLKVGLYGKITSVKDDTSHKWLLYCLDKKTGKLLWSRTAHQGVPRIKRHTKASHANSTPATDGKHVVAFFGSEGLYCYDMDGKLLWKQDLGLLDSGFYRAPDAQWGFGSSPIIHDDMVIVQCDVQQDSFIAALSIKDGREIWQTPRTDVPTWSTPTIHESADRKQIIVNGYRHIGGYDLNTGKPLWWLEGGGDIPVPTPVVAHDLTYITNAHGDMAPIYAIRLNATGDISLQPDTRKNKKGVTWAKLSEGAYMQTPLVYGDRLYVCRDNGVMAVYEAKTGRKLYTARLGKGSSGFTASAVAADGKVYYTSEMGDVSVVADGTEFELLATNSLDDICMATPAISEGTLFFRTRNHLIAVAK